MDLVTLSRGEILISLIFLIYFRSEYWLKNLDQSKKLLINFKYTSLFTRDGNDLRTNALGNTHF